jgi:hypothetical protein
MTTESTAPYLRNEPEWLQSRPATRIRWLSSGVGSDEDAKEWPINRQAARLLDQVQNDSKSTDLV